MREREREREREQCHTFTHFVVSHQRATQNEVSLEPVLSHMSLLCQVSSLHCSRQFKELLRTSTASSKHNQERELPIGFLFRLRAMLGRSSKITDLISLKELVEYERGECGAVVGAVELKVPVVKGRDDWC